MKYRILIVSLFIILLAGCATAQKMNLVRVGMTKEEVINVMGTPASMSAKEGTEYLNYSLSETSDQAFYGITGPYYVRLIKGKVDSFGRLGDFDSTQKPTVKIETDENIKANVSSKSDLYSELKKLKELRDDGIITEAEFEKEKQELLEKY